MYNTRDIALNIITDIIDNNAYNNLALKKALHQNNFIRREDKAFITEIVNGTLRNIIYIDYIIEQFSSVKLKKIKPFLLNLIRISVYQIKFMDRVPEFAICNEAVLIAKKRGYSKLSGFVNGILRNIIRNKNNLNLPDEKEESLKYLSTVYSYPQWIIKKWLNEYDYSFVKDICIKNNINPDITICVNRLKTDSDKLKNFLEQKSINVSDSIYCNYALHLSKTSDISNLDEYNNGFFHVQDESSMIAVDILDPQSGELIIDVCAAPGGKSLVCAEKMKNNGIIKSRDIYEHKLKLINDTAKRLGISIIQTQNIDATILDKSSIRKADRVLADVPCSGLGMIRKRADIKLKKNESDIKSLQQLQRKILTISSEYVKLNGIFVYSTCTISKEENIDNINWFIENFPFELEDISHLLPNKLESKKGYIQLYPNVHNTDGFFIARMIRKR